MKLATIKNLLTQLISTRKPVRSLDRETKLYEVNILPLKNIFLFPGGMLPLYIFEERYKAMADDALKRHIPLAMSHAVNPNIQPGMICGGGKVRLLEEYPDHRKNILVEGEGRFCIRKIVQSEPFCKVLAEKVSDIPFASPHLESESRLRLETNVKRWIFTNPSVDDNLMNYIFIFERPHQLADFIGNHFLPTAALKRKLLEEPDCAKRVEVVNLFLEDEVQKFVTVLQNNSNLVVTTPRSEMN